MCLDMSVASTCGQGGITGAAENLPSTVQLDLGHLNFSRSTPRHLFPEGPPCQTQTRPLPTPPPQRQPFPLFPVPDPPAHHVDDHLAQALPLALAEVLEDVTVVLLQQLEAHSQMVVLQHRLVIVHECQL